MVTTFALTFLGLLVAILAMSVGVIFKRRPIGGSCGGLNAVAGADRCVVCKRPVDPEDPLRDRLDCPRRVRRENP